MLEKKDDGSRSGIEFNDTLYADFAHYDLLAEAKRVSCVLVIHGEMDEVVPSREGKAIYEQAKEPKKFELIKGADHVFSVPGHRERAISLSHRLVQAVPRLVLTSHGNPFTRKPGTRRRSAHRNTQTQKKGLAKHR